MRWQDFIRQKPGVLCGKPVFIGTRISVEMILDEFGAGDSIIQIGRSHPGITADHLHAAAAYAAHVLRGKQSAVRRKSRYKLKDILKNYQRLPKELDFPPSGRELALCAIAMPSATLTNESSFLGVCATTKNICEANIAPHDAGIIVGIELRQQRHRLVTLIAFGRVIALEPARIASRLSSKIVDSTERFDRGVKCFPRFFIKRLGDFRDVFVEGIDPFPVRKRLSAAGDKRAQVCWLR